MKTKTIYIRNGELIQPFVIYYCEHCGREIPESHPRHESNNCAYCGDCAFLLGLVNEKEYLKIFCFFIQMAGLRAAVHEGKIHLGTGKFHWEKKSRNRNSKQYNEWRKRVFERDGYKCQICGQVGGTLNAHHIRSYKDYPDLRLDVDNGVTLCESCHKSVHKKDKENDG